MRGRTDPSYSPLVGEGGNEFQRVKNVRKKRAYETGCRSETKGWSAGQVSNLPHHSQAVG